MAKSVRIIICILLAVYLLLSLPVLYFCAMNIFISLTTHANNVIQNPRIYIIVSVVILLLNIATIISLIIMLKKNDPKNSRTQTAEELANTRVRRKYLRNRWFIVPLALPAICFVFSALSEIILRMHTSNSAFIALEAVSGLIITFATIPLIITSIVLAGIKKISLGEMVVSIGSYLFVFFFVISVIASRARDCSLLRDKILAVVRSGRPSGMLNLYIIWGCLVVDFQKYFHMAQQKKQPVNIPLAKIPWSEVVDECYDKQLTFMYDVSNVIYTDNKTERAVILRKPDGLYTVAFERLYPFDDDILEYGIYDLHGFWQNYSGFVSLFDTEERAANSIMSEPPFKYNNCQL